MPVDYQSALIEGGVATELIDLVSKQYVDFSKIFEVLRPAPSAKNPYGYVEFSWQLLALGKKDLDCASLPEEEWTQCDEFGGTLVDYLAWSGNVTAIQWVVDNKIELIERSFILHTAATAGNAALLIHMLRNNPVLAKKLWVSNKDRHSPQDLAHVDMNPKPDQLLDNELILATKRIIEDRANENDRALLIAFQEKWLTLLLTSQDYDRKQFIAKLSNFPDVLEDKISKIKSSLELQSFSHDESGKLTRKKLKELIDLAKAIKSPASSLFKMPLDPLIEALGILLKTLHDESLNEVQIYFLKLIIADYEGGFYGEPNFAARELIRHLTRSSTLSIDPIADAETESFEDFINRIIDTEYKPYMEIMAIENEGEDILQLPYTACDFILERYLGRACQPHSLYATSGIISTLEVKKYFQDAIDGLDKSLVSDVDLRRLMPSC